MADRQLDLFSIPAGTIEACPAPPPARPLVELDDAGLLQALGDAGMRGSIAAAEEAGTRGLRAAIPALEAMCRRFAGFGLERVVPEQAAALDALDAIDHPRAEQIVAAARSAPVFSPH